MFTGIVEEKGKIESIHQTNQALQIKINGKKVTEDVAIGDSISVNGVCLTVTNFDANWFTVDVIPETFRSSSLAKLTAQSSVNLERAMHANGRFGGHFVSGHVDAVGTIERTWQEDNAKYYYITVSDTRYISLKGSISVDGTSLTVFGVDDKGFTISLIPETQKATTLGAKRQGDIVNVEFDMLAKYMERLLQTRDQPAEELTEEKLKQYGF
ncbi:riboflavin synthase eubacterial/eukaryotic [Gracilibacillus boraciitolerans JCM 21714]|uniref:Riboflavin synthase n=1 Tax=Gracilibacillus boraciitolerans JCM 21714 TaxID=1298598 RepID=W4VK43_9BACI|nr:riboflavin synthase [Gracilibacillus boraciitolerans]GAE93511.1 riboflavin synthase eubacterial/eukaryotic [Gracilibacillus boraciitolerans JCM 21714]